MTLAEMHAHVAALSFRRTIIAHLIEHLDAEFMPELDQQPKKVLLTETKMKVPQAVFDAVAADLGTWIKSLLAEEKKLLDSAVELTTPPPDPTPTQSEAKS